MKIAVFDVCGTLYDSNTTFDFLDDYFQNDIKYRLFRRFSRTLFAKVMNYPFYRYFNYDVTRLVATSFLKGTPKQELQLATKVFVHDKLENKIKKEIVVLLNDYKSRGYIIFLMSGSYSLIVEQVSLYVDADGFVASELEIVSDIYTGKYKTDQLFNKREVLKEKYPNISELVVVSDNRTDFELMKMADKGYAVCNKSKQISFWKSKQLKHVEILA